jgi:hypothetical protein
MNQKTESAMLSVFTYVFFTNLARNDIPHGAAYFALNFSVTASQLTTFHHALT